MVQVSAPFPESSLIIPVAMNPAEPELQARIFYLPERYVASHSLGLSRENLPAQLKGTAGLLPSTKRQDLTGKKKKND